MAKVSLRAYNKEIEAMIDRTHLDEAVAHCQHILKTFPKHLETYRLLGKAYLEARRHNEAVDIFSRVLAAEPNDFVAHVGMSIIRDEQSKLDDAIWHMERAYEVQSANPAIMGELQRLYGRRDGVQPPRIRMTRGALAHMYMRGELYPQAISETMSVLEEDQGRSDMQVLLAKAYYRSGQKKDAADAASAVLKRYPFCLDANLVLSEVLGTDRPESAQVYRHRVVELDPYAAQAADSMFRAAEVSDAAVSIDHLEWNGQPVGMSADWGTEQAIALEGGLNNREEQPDWLKESLPSESSTGPSAPASDSAQETLAQPADDIPDFLRAAGWGESTGAFDESKATMFADEPASPAEPLAQGDLPDWVKAMKPAEDSQPAEEREEEVPDWINKIGTGDLPVPSEESSGDQPDWLSGLGETSSSTDQPDWMKENEAEEEPAPQATEDQPDWMRGVGDEEQPAAQPVDDQPDWMKGLGEEDVPAPQATENQPDWIKDFAEERMTSQPADDQLDWLKDLGSEQPSSEFDFLDELTHEPEESAQPVPTADKVDTGSLGKSEEEQDDSFAWLENLAAKQGATEGLLTNPEERLEDEPDWIKQAKSLTQPSDEQTPVPQQPVEATPSTPVEEPTAKVEDTGKSGQEIDDALAWFESLAAKQGATEGLLTKPEDRKEQEPEWVKQAKSADAQQPPVEQTPVEPASVEEKIAPEPETEPEPEAVSPPAPTESVEDLGKSGEEIDDALAWFESLAAKQGATEGLLTKPEDRKEQEPEWVKQAKQTSEQQPSASQTPDEEEAVPQPEPEVEEHIPGTETMTWLKGLAEEEGARESAPEEEEGMDTIAWLKTLDEPEETPITPDSATDGLPTWMQNVSEDEAVETEAAIPMEETEPVDELPAPIEESKTEDVAAWLSSLEEEEEQPPSIPASDELPAWMRDETGEVMAEPTKIEPTRSADWKPADEKKDETPEPAQPVPQSAPPTMAEAKPEPKPEAKPVPKKKKPAPKKEEIKPATPPEPYKEPVTQRGAGMLTMPVDPILGSARAELSRSNIPGALETYGKLIKKGRFLEEVIYDLREALYRYPVEVSIWQTLGDAYMRANQLQDALDAYTKAEELLR